MKKIIITFALILGVGSVCADISTKIVKPSQSLDQIIEKTIVTSTDNNINFLPSSHVDKPLGLEVALSSVCTNYCYDVYQNCIHNTSAPIYQCFDQYGDCMAACSGGGGGF